MTAAPLRLVLTTDAVGGVWTYALELAAALGSRSVETLLAVLGPPPGAAQADAAARAEVAWTATGLPLEWLCDGPEPVLAAGQALARMAANWRADIVQLNTPALAAEARFSAPVIAMEHGAMATWWAGVHREALPAGLAWQRDLTAAGLRRSARALAPSEAHARAMAEVYALEAVPMVVHNGRNVSSGPIRSRCEAAAFTAGRLWDRAKDVRSLDRAASHLALPFRAAGALTGPHGESVAPEHLEILGEIDPDGMARQLARRPVFVSAACFEPFGLAVLEAAQAGCALVLADIPVFRELWDGAAAFARPQDDHALARLVRALCDDPVEQDRMGRAARQRAARYGVPRMADAMARLYRSVAGAAATGRRAA